MRDWHYYDITLYNHVIICTFRLSHSHTLSVVQSYKQYYQCYINSGVSRNFQGGEAKILNLIMAFHTKNVRVMPQFS